MKTVLSNNVLSIVRRDLLVVTVTLIFDIVSAPPTKSLRVVYDDIMEVWYEQII